MSRTTDRRKLLRLLTFLTALRIMPGAAAAASKLDFRELYVRGTDPTEKTLSLAGKVVTMQGFMAPPLKAEADFFVLTKMPMAVCPFCDSTMDWPDDIVLVLTDGLVDIQPFTAPISVEGVLSVGFRKEEETGFVSFVRLESARYWRD